MLDMPKPKIAFFGYPDGSCFVNMCQLPYAEQCEPSSTLAKLEPGTASAISCTAIRQRSRGPKIFADAINPSCIPGQRNRNPRHLNRKNETAWGMQDDSRGVDRAQQREID